MGGGEVTHSWTPTVLLNSVPSAGNPKLGECQHGGVIYHAMEKSFVCGSPSAAPAVARGADRELQEPDTAADGPK